MTAEQDKKNAAFYYSVNMLRLLLRAKLLTEAEYKKNCKTFSRSLQMRKNNSRLIIKIVDILQFLFTSDRCYDLKIYEINDIISLKLILPENVNGISRNRNQRIKKSIK